MKKILILFTVLATAFTPVVAAQERRPVVIVNDFCGDPDGYFALTHQLLCESTEIRGIVGSHLNPGIEDDMAEISVRNVRKILSIMGIDGKVPLVKGASDAMAFPDKPINSDGAELIIAEARKCSPENPLFLLVGGPLTDAASAFLLAPYITDNVILVWIGGQEYPFGHQKPRSGVSEVEYNLGLDIAAARAVFNGSNVRLWQVPRDTYRRCCYSFASIEKMRSYGTIGTFLAESLDMMKSGKDVYVLGDSPLVLLSALQTYYEPDTASSDYVEVKAPRIGTDGRYSFRKAGRKIRVYTAVDSFLMFSDMEARLQNLSSGPRMDHPNGYAWGDTEDGRYLNPVLAADYSDPDVIRHGDKYYMVASDFHFLGMQVLESEDLVNWKIISQVYSRFNLPGWDTMQHYAGGSWAPSLRFHDGKFYVYFCTPDEGLFMSEADAPEGPWSPLHCVKAIPEWEDPCPFWDEDGKAYLGHSLYGAGPIIIHRMSDDGRNLLDDGVTVYEGPVAEGTKIHKIGAYYYLSIPEGGVESGWQTVLRSKDIYGPYERKIVLETGSTNINGPHQGAMVDTPYGEWWFLHFQDRDPLGRILHLQPMHWEDGWPVIGEDYDGNGIGEPVKGWTKPTTGKSVGRSLPQSSDEFDGPFLGLQWQFNHNPVDSAWSLALTPGSLSLDALFATDFKHARNTLSQKLMGFQGSYITQMDITDFAKGQLSGMVCMGSSDFCTGVRRTESGDMLCLEKDGILLESIPLDVREIWLKLEFDAADNHFSYFYSTDGTTFSAFGDPFEAHSGYWKGVRAGLFSYNTEANSGTARFVYFQSE